MGPFEPQQALRPRGVFRIAGSSLAALLRSLPALFGLLIIFAGVSTIALLAVAVPVLMATNVDRNIGGNEVGAFISLLMAVVAIPFFLIWGSGTQAALLALLGARSIGLRQGAGQAYSIGLKRALPLLGTDILFGMAKAVVLLPVGFLWLAAAFFFGLARSSEQPAFALVAVPLAAFAGLLALVAIHLLMRLLFARFATVFENAGPVASLERAWSLSHRHGLRIFGYVFIGLSVLVGALALAGWGLADAMETLRPPITAMERALGGLSFDQGPSAIVAGLLQAAPGAALLAVPGMFACLLGLWFQTALMALYFDLRHRDEGFGGHGGLDPDFDLDLAAPEALPDRPDLPPLPPDTAAGPLSAETGAVSDLTAPIATASRAAQADAASGDASGTAGGEAVAADGPPPAPWELARLAEALGSGDGDSSPVEDVDESPDPASPTTVGASPAPIEAVIPEVAPARDESEPSAEDERALADAIARAAEGDASPGEAQARWRIVDRLLRWLPEADEDDDAPPR